MPSKSVDLEGRHSFESILGGTLELPQNKKNIFDRALIKIFPRYAAIRAADFPTAKIDIAENIEVSSDFSAEKTKLLELMVKAAEKGGRLPS